MYTWNLCLTPRDSPCGQCRQRREAGWRLRLRCFSGPGTQKIQIKTPSSEHSNRVWEQLDGEFSTHLAQGTVGLFIEELDLIGSRACLFVREAPRNLTKDVRLRFIKEWTMKLFRVNPFNTSALLRSVCLLHQMKGGTGMGSVRQTITSHDNMFGSLKIFNTLYCD